MRKEICGVGLTTAICGALALCLFGQFRTLRNAAVARIMQALQNGGADFAKPRVLYKCDPKILDLRSALTVTQKRIGATRGECCATNPRKLNERENRLAPLIQTFHLLNVSGRCPGSINATPANG